MKRRKEGVIRDVPGGTWSEKAILFIHLYTEYNTVVSTMTVVSTVRQSLSRLRTYKAGSGGERSP